MNELAHAGVLFRNLSVGNQTFNPEPKIRSKIASTEPLETLLGVFSHILEIPKLASIPKSVAYHQIFSTRYTTLPLVHFTLFRVLILWKLNKRCHLFNALQNRQTSFDISHLRKKRTLQKTLFSLPPIVQSFNPLPPIPRTRRIIINFTRPSKEYSRWLSIGAFENQPVRTADFSSCCLGQYDGVSLSANFIFMVCLRYFEYLDFFSLST